MTSSATHVSRAWGGGIHETLSSSSSCAVWGMEGRGHRQSQHLKSGSIKLTRPYLRTTALSANIVSGADCCSTQAKLGHSKQISTAKSNSYLLDRQASVRKFLSGVRPIPFLDAERLYVLTPPTVRRGTRDLPPFCSPGLFTRCFSIQLPSLNRSFKTFYLLPLTSFGRRSPGRTSPSLSPRSQTLRLRRCARFCTIQWDGEDANG